MDKFKTHLEELEEMLMPNGVLKENIDKAVIKICNETDPNLEDKWWEEFDNALNIYLKHYVEYDRLKR